MTFLEGMAIDTPLLRPFLNRQPTVASGEVKVTQASSGGNAIAFDPDPVRCGKVVIQAKRYTNVVGVSASHDLYGTAINEGATKGIIVTTSDYRRGSCEFAKGKPLALLNGSNLLSMPEQHGGRLASTLPRPRRSSGRRRQSR